MKKFVRIVGGILCAALCFNLAACTDKQKPSGDKLLNNETEIVKFSLEGADGVFNPFFSTTAYDSEVVGQTQIGMFTVSGKEAKISYGDDQPSVVQDYTETRLDSSNRPMTGSGMPAFTEYAMLIKNGIKFSDGTPLTIRDVLFNLYVYLDPVYTGSATIYSTEIVGLNQYRTQEEGGETNEAFEQGFLATARTRILAMSDYCQYYIHLQDSSKPAGNLPTDPNKLKQVKADIEIVKSLYRDELKADYQTAKESIVDMAKEYTLEISKPWQLFLYYEGLAAVTVDEVTKLPKKDSQGKYIIDYADFNETFDEYLADPENYKDITAANPGMKEEDVKALAAQAFATQMVWETNIEAENNLGETEMNYPEFQMVLSYSASADSILTRFTAEAKSDYFAELKESGQLAYPNISGITQEKVTKFNSKTLDGSYDVLKIKIKGVDPKAIWNFAFTVAPMHYYSSQKYITDTAKYPYGVDYASTAFMNDVVKDPKKLGVPVGAGAYMASKEGGLAKPTDRPASNKFMENNVIYYERNPYFETVGKKLKNAKVKFICYKVVNSAQAVGELVTGAVDVGTPSGTQANRTELSTKSNLLQSETKTNGYGYIGINAAKVPDIAVRRAIMSAMNTAEVLNYYPPESCERIFWPMSSTSWAYPKDGQQYPYYRLKTGDAILRDLEAAGYEQKTDASGKDMLGKEVNGVWTQLSYTFTIPGSTDDHPAALMLTKAEQTLNAIGFKIQVKTDNWALKKLATGDLAIWAAAWSSTIDPDMYQVYHIDSNAGSTKNWGYDAIKKDKEKYATEYELILKLSQKIDAARETTDQTTRADIYAGALVDIMDLAVEMPTYQRSDLTVINTNKIDRKSLTPQGELGPNNSLFARIWEMDLI